MWHVVDFGLLSLGMDAIVAIVIILGSKATKR